MDDCKIVDATGLACPKPVILAKEAVESCDRVLVIVDNETALENVKRLGAKLGCDVASEKKADGTLEIRLVRDNNDGSVGERDALSCREDNTATGGPFVMVIAEDRMGRGDEQLGEVLMKAFINTVAERDLKPRVMIFYNTGVRLTLEGSAVLDDLQKLQAAGVELLVCGTCLNYFEVKDRLAAGVVSNMFDIVDAMSGAGRLVCP